MSGMVCGLLAWPTVAIGQEAPVAITRGTLRVLLPARPAAGYFTVINRGDATLTLTGASSPACGSVMLHRSVSSGGMESMMDVGQVRLPAHASIAFAPGGTHLMCVNPGMLHSGETVPVTLRFAGGTVAGGSLTVKGAR